MISKETEEEKQIRIISEQSNPYKPTCKNKHLWSEGFRAGIRYVTQWKLFDSIGQRPEFDELVLVKSSLGMIEVAKYEKNDNGINLFDKEKELENFTVEYYRELF